MTQIADPTFPGGTSPLAPGKARPSLAAEFQKEAESEGKKKGKFKTIKVLKMLGNKRDTKSKSPGDKS